MRTWSATPSQIFWKLRWPSSVPFLFTSLKVSITISLIGAIVAELPTGAQAGIGARLLAGSYYGQTVQIWAALVAASILAVGLIGLVDLIERWVGAAHGSAFMTVAAGRRRRRSFARGARRCSPPLVVAAVDRADCRAVRPADAARRDAARGGALCQRGIFAAGASIAVTFAGVLLGCCDDACFAERRQHRRLLPHGASGSRCWQTGSRPGWACPACRLQAARQDSIARCRSCDPAAVRRFSVLSVGSRRARLWRAAGAVSGRRA